MQEANLQPKRVAPPGATPDDKVTGSSGTVLTIAIDGAYPRPKTSLFLFGNVVGS